MQCLRQHMAKTMNSHQDKQTGDTCAPSSDSPANVKCCDAPAGSHLVVTIAASPGAPCVRHRPPPAAFAMVRPVDGTTASWSKNAVANPSPEDHTSIRSWPVAR